MADAWVVYGQTGEYSDHVEWLVCVYVGEDAEAKATRHADRAAERVKARETAECKHGEPLNRWCEDCWDADPDSRSAAAFRAWMGDPSGERVSASDAIGAAVKVALGAK